MNMVGTHKHFEVFDRLTCLTLQPSLGSRNFDNILLERKMVPHLVKIPRLPHNNAVRYYFLYD